MHKKSFFIDLLGAIKENNSILFVKSKIPDQSAMLDIKLQNTFTKQQQHGLADLYPGSRYLDPLKYETLFA